MDQAASGLGPQEEPQGPPASRQGFLAYTSETTLAQRQLNRRHSTFYNYATNPVQSPAPGQLKKPLTAPGGNKGWTEQPPILRQGFTPLSVSVSQLTSSLLGVLTAQRKQVLPLATRSQHRLPLTRVTTVAADTRRTDSPFSPLLQDEPSQALGTEVIAEVHTASRQDGHRQAQLCASVPMSPAT